MKNATGSFDTSTRRLTICLTWLLLMVAAPTTDAARVALVIGNARYERVPLTNPVRDAEDMAAELEKLGFQVILKTDANKANMVDAARRFGSALRDGDVGLFYYSGHGLQYQGINYLVPLQADIQNEGEIEFAAMPAARILRQMQLANTHGVNIIILDACRDNPFKGFLKSTQLGLAQMESPQGSLIAYATAPGSVAFDDGGQRNSIYTKHLLAVLRSQPYLELPNLLINVARNVYQETHGKQTPWQSLSLLTPFSFAKAPATPAPLPLPLPTPTPQTMYVIVPIRSTPKLVDTNDARQEFGLTTRQMAWGKTNWAPHQYIENEFEDRGEVVVDHATGLMWQKVGSSNRLTYDQALEYVKQLNRDTFAGYDDWRLPTIPELMSLLEPERQSNGLYINPIFKTRNYEWCWSSDKRSGSSSAAWYVAFLYGSVYWNRLDTYYVRAVRS